MTKTQVDRLGERLKKTQFEEADLHLLHSYRQSFAVAYSEVVNEVRAKMELQPTGRPSKSTPSIIDKLRRESVRLSQIQDIAGCRLVVGDIADQELVIDKLKATFPQSAIIDRRKNPSHGYRALHFVIKRADRTVEIQVRTLLQQLWAEFSEKLADVVDPAIKYGGGDERLRQELLAVSDTVSALESLEAQLFGMVPLSVSAPGMFNYAKHSDSSPEIKSVRQSVESMKIRLAGILKKKTDDVRKATS